MQERSPPRLVGVNPLAGKPGRMSAARTERSVVNGEPIGEFLLCYAETVGVDLDARPHRGGERNFAQVLALG